MSSIHFFQTTLLADQLDQRVQIRGPGTNPAAQPEPDPEMHLGPEQPRLLDSGRSVLLQLAPESDRPSPEPKAWLGLGFESQTVSSFSGKRRRPTPAEHRLRRHHHEGLRAGVAGQRVSHLPSGHLVLVRRRRQPGGGQEGGAENRGKRHRRRRRSRRGKNVGRVGRRTRGPREVSVAERPLLRPPVAPVLRIGQSGNRGRVKKGRKTFRLFENRTSDSGPRSGKSRANQDR